MRFDSETVFSGSLEGVLRSLLVLRLHAAAFEEREQRAPFFESIHGVNQNFHSRWISDPGLVVPTRVD
ncbi:hypothetical protein RUM44_004230 [Polyplax serrata]|uniref:Uncharacterized protein n=1 Tax=Polyplax serrata TaxID=468196 RepID=A0ABR1B284_POLSC